MVALSDRDRGGCIGRVVLEGGMGEGGGRFHGLPLIEDGKLLESQPRGRRAPRLYASRSRLVPCIWPMSDRASLRVESGMTSAVSRGDGHPPSEFA